MYLLDTNHCSLAILGNVNLLSRFAEVENSLVSSCVIVQGELIDMAARSQKQEINLALVRNFIRGIYIYNIDQQTANTSIMIEYFYSRMTFKLNPTREQEDPQLL